MADGSIRINTELANEKLKAGLKDIQKMVQSSADTIKRSFDSIDKSTDLKNITTNIKKAIGESEKQIQSLQKQIDNFSTNKSIKEVQKMIDVANKEIDKSKSKIDVYQKKLDSIDIQKDNLVNQIREQTPRFYADTKDDFDNRVDKNLSENKDFQKLICQEEIIVKEMEKYESAVLQADSKVKTLLQTLENTKSIMNEDLSSGIERAFKKVNILNDELNRTSQLQEQINQINSSLKDEEFLSKIKNEEEYDQLLQETLDKMSLIEVESEKISNNGSFSYDDLILGNEQYSQMYHELMLLINNQDRFTQSVGGTSAMIDALKERFPLISSKLQGLVSIIGTVKSAVETINEKLSPVVQKISSIKNKISSLIPHFKKASTSGKGFGDNVSSSAEKGIKKLAKMGLAILGLRSAFMGVRKAINQVLESNQKAQDTIATFWKGISNLIQPVITTVVNGLGTIMSYVNSIYKVFTGKDLFTPVSAATSSAASSAKELADNAKEAKRQLAGFDEMQVLSSNDNSSSGSNSSSGKANEFSLDVFDVSAITSKLEELFEPLKNAWNKYGEAFISSFKYALTEVWNLVKSIGASFEEIWLNGTGELTCSLILQILTNVFNIIGNIASGLTKAWNEAGLGTAIIQDLWDIFNDILKIIESITNGLTIISGRIDFTPLLEGIKSVTGLFKELFDIAAKTTEEIINNLLGGDFSGAGNALSNGLDSMLITIKDFINNIDWKGIGEGFGKITNAFVDFFSGINWMKLAEDAHDVIISAISGIVDMIGSWLSTVDWVQVISTTFIAVSAAIKGLATIIWDAVWVVLGSILTGIVNWIGDIVTNIWEGLQKGLEGLKKWFSNLFKGAWTNIKAIFSYSNVKTFFGNVWTWIKNRFASVKTWFSSLFKGAWTNIKAIFSYSNVKTFFGNVWTWIKNRFASVKTWFSSLFKGAWTNIKAIFSYSNVKTFFGNVWANIKGCFGSISDWFRTSFSNAWQAVKNVFSTGGQIFSGITDGILNGLKSIINVIIDGINKVVSIPFNGLNSALKTIRDINLPIIGKPFKGLISLVSVPQIPRLAKGGIVNTPTQFIAGEAGKEAVLPLQNHTEWMDMLASKIVEKMDISSNQENMTIILKIGDQEFYRWLMNMKKKKSLILNGG